MELITQQEISKLTGLKQGLISNILSNFGVKAVGKRTSPESQRPCKVYDRTAALTAVQSYYRVLWTEYERRITECQNSIANINNIILKGE